MLLLVITGTPSSSRLLSRTAITSKSAFVLNRLLSFPFSFQSDPFSSFDDLDNLDEVFYSLADFSTLMKLQSSGDVFSKGSPKHASSVAASEIAISDYSP